VMTLTCSAFGVIAAHAANLPEVAVAPAAFKPPA